MKSRLLILLIIISMLPMSACKKQTYNRLLGKWDRQMVNYAQDLSYGHRNMIGQQWDFRDFKYVFKITTWSGQAGHVPGDALDSLPTISTERLRYEVVKKKEIIVTPEVDIYGRIYNGDGVTYKIVQLDDNILRLNIVVDGVVGDSFDFVRSEEQ